MAVDTATKRYAMINFGAADLMMPVPDGTVAAVDRSHFLGMYLAGGAAAPVTVGFANLRYNLTGGMQPLAGGLN